MKEFLEEFDVVVIGGGPAGMAAACTADKENLRVAIIERDSNLGGILNQCAHKGFGITYFGEELTGQEYARRYIPFVENSNVEVFTDTMVMNIDENRIITISGAATRLDRIRAKAVVLSTGCRERPIGALPIVGSRPAGVFMAGTAQKMLNIGGYDIGNRFVILGSGDIGLIVARELAIRGKEVVAVIEKEDKCGGLVRNRINCLERYNIPLITRTTVSKVHGMPRINGVTIRSTSGEEKFIACDTLITSVGLIPERDLLDNLAADSVPEWLFVCGNAAYVHDLVDDVTIESEQVGKLAAAFVLGKEISVSEPSVSDACDSQQEAIAEEQAAEETAVCVACPKSCVGVKINGEWTGLACGRKEPKLAI